MKFTRRSKAAAIAIVLVGLGISKVVFLPSFPPGAIGPHLVCHKILDGALMQWMLESKSEAFPNLQGDSAKSFAALGSWLGSMDDFSDYNYVPGLRPDDPKDLVVFFVRRKSRQRWHGDTPSIFRRAMWVTMGPSPDAVDDWYELSQSVETDEMRQRLERTMRYLKEHNRPNWQQIVKEQSELLKQIHD